MNNQEILFTICAATYLFISFTLKYHQKWGVKVIQFIQKGMTPTTNRIVRTIAFLGFEIIPMGAPILMWSGINRVQQLGIDMFTIMLYTLYNQSALKLVYREHRPKNVIRFVKGKGDAIVEKEYSFPSGHSWATTALWLMISHFPESKEMQIKVRYVALVFSLLIGFTRVYSGVHFPHDVIAGWCCGIITLFIYDNRVAGPYDHLYAALAMFGLNFVINHLNLISSQHRQDGLWVAPALIIGSWASKYFFSLDLLFSLTYSKIDIIIRAVVGFSFMSAFFVALFALIDRMVILLSFCVVIPVFVLYVLPLLFQFYITPFAHEMLQLN